MIKSLKEGSKSYHSEAEIYEIFKKAEDFPQKVIRFLRPKIKRKIILDIGCGNGEYARIFAPLAKIYFGLDSSKEQLKIAKRKTKSIRNIKLILSSAQKIKLPSESIEIIISLWTISAIKGFKRKEEALKEAERILKRYGAIYLIENDRGGEFQQIRERFKDKHKKDKETKKYHDWLRKKGFGVASRINTYFKFNSLQDAKNIIMHIWGKKVSSLIKDRIIKHKVIIFKKNKT